MEDNITKWDMSIVEATDGEVVIKHHSTSSVVEIICKESESSLYLDYYEFESLIKIIDHIRFANT